MSTSSEWDEDDTCTERDSEDSPILSYRLTDKIIIFTTDYNNINNGYDKSCYTYKKLRPERDRRWAVTSVAKFSFYCTAMILFCVLMYIPVYNRANDQLPKVVIADWTAHSNRDTKIYVQPDNVSTVHEPKDVCPESNRDKKNSLFLLIVVSSSTVNFDRRVAIRETWGSYQNYLKYGKSFKEVQEKYKNYNYTYELNDENMAYLNVSVNLSSKKRDISGFERFQGSVDKEIDFKLVFLLGMPSQSNDTEIQDKIENEVEKYGDIIQEFFIDSYYNLTLKSIMMLKWVTNNCEESVRYILKTDDDIYVNVPKLVQNLRSRSRVHDNTMGQEKEYLLIGYLIYGARPIRDRGNKWYSPVYMYSGSVYPHYLSGTAYVLSAPAASALYHAALQTAYFHLEDIYITGMCSAHASPRIVPRDEPAFDYYQKPLDSCTAHARLTAHYVPTETMRIVAARLLRHAHVDRCERLRLTQVRKERTKPKQQTKKLAKMLFLSPSTSGQLDKLGATRPMRQHLSNVWQCKPGLNLC